MGLEDMEKESDIFVKIIVYFSDFDQYVDNWNGTKSE